MPMIWKALDNLFETRIWKLIEILLTLFLLGSLIRLLLFFSYPADLSPAAAGRTDPGFHAYINDSFYDGILAVAVFGFLALVKITNVVRDYFIAQQYRSLANTMLRFADGNISDRFGQNSSREVNQLGRAFNHMADSLQSLIEELRNSEKRRKEIVANVAHDLAGPLTAISGYTETLNRSLENLAGETRQDYFDVIKSNIKTLTRLISELSELSRLDTDEIPPEKDLFSLRVLANDIVSRFAIEAEEKGLKIALDETGSEAMIFADMHMMERVISNLVENSIRYTPEGGRISLTCLEDEGSVIMEVTDNGLGIPSEHLPFIFERFYRVDKDRSRQSGGSGLGLAIVKKIVEIHAGKVSISSVSTKGTTISIHLPKPESMAESDSAPSKTHLTS